MMTRSAAIKELEVKLRASLKELQDSKALNIKLLQEIADSEVEVENVVHKNTFLKNELAELHTQHQDLAEQHQVLQYQVANYQKCSDTYELTLNRVSELEQDLCNAHKALSIAESAKISEQCKKTNSLYNELVDSFQSEPVCESDFIIDLTGEDTIPLCPIVMSHNKLKKYIKIKKILKRSRRATKKQNLLKLNISLRKERINLTSKLNTCMGELDNCREKYDKDTQCLQNDLLYKECLLKDIFEKYESSQQQLSERLFEAGELLDLVKHNAERYESLTNSSCSCANYPPPPQLQSDLSPPMLALPEKTCVHNVKECNTTLFSDEIGSGFGKILQNYLSHSFTNHCYHNISLKQMINRIINSNIDNCSTMVLLLGNSTGITKKDIMAGIDTLLGLNVGKLMVCAFPYSHNFSEDENKRIFKLNNTIQMLTCHSDKLLFFDTNKFISGLNVTQRAFSLTRRCRHKIAMLIAYSINEMYLPPSCRRQIANPLAYNIHCDTGTCSVPSITVSSGTNTTIDTPCSLNY